MTNYMIKERIKKNYDCNKLNNNATITTTYTVDYLANVKFTFSYRLKRPFCFGSKTFKLGDIHVITPEVYEEFNNEFKAYVSSFIKDEKMRNSHMYLEDLIIQSIHSDIFNIRLMPAVLYTQRIYEESILEINKVLNTKYHDYLQELNSIDATEKAKRGAERYVSQFQIQLKNKQVLSDSFKKVLALDAAHAIDDDVIKKIEEDMAEKDRRLEEKRLKEEEEKKAATKTVPPPKPNNTESKSNTTQTQKQRQEYDLSGFTKLVNSLENKQK